MTGALAAYAAILDGDGTIFSLGGVSPKGLSGSHCNIEGDASPLKSDLNQYGTNTRLVIEQFVNVSLNARPLKSAQHD